MNKQALANKLWAAIDSLEDSDGFVLVATSDEITFTRLHSDAGWDNDAILELAPLNEPEARSELARLGRLNDDLAKRNTELRAQIEAGKQRLADLRAAIANALGAQRSEAA
jgi:hypothetical protein